MAAPMTQEQWAATMKPYYDHPMPKELKMTMKPTITLLTDSLAQVTNDCTMTMGKVKKTFKTSTLVIKKGGRWLFKMGAEGGWGDGMHN
jgi:hypothetical protein